MKSVYETIVAIAISVVIGTVIAVCIVLGLLKVGS
jgi:hypothetical protein